MINLQTKKIGINHATLQQYMQVYLSSIEEDWLCLVNSGVLVQVLLAEGG